MSPSAISAIIVAGLPYVPALIADITGLFKKYPQLTPTQLAAMIAAAAAQSDAAANDALSTIAADQAPKQG